MQPPFMSSLGLTKCGSNVVFDWQTGISTYTKCKRRIRVATRTSSRAASTATVRAGNGCAISKSRCNCTRISREFQIQQVKGQKWLINLLLCLKLSKRDMEEKLYVKRKYETTGDATTARVTGGFESLDVIQRLKTTSYTSSCRITSCFAPFDIEPLPYLF